MIRRQVDENGWAVKYFKHSFLVNRGINWDEIGLVDSLRFGLSIHLIVFLIQSFKVRLVAMQKIYGPTVREETGENTIEN